MDRQNLKFIIFLVLAALSIIIIISPSCHGVTHETLYTICSLTQNEEICVHILQTDPRTNSSTLPQLSLISIDLTRNQAEKNRRIFTDLRDNSTSPTLKAAYENCLKIYGDLMVSKINEAYQLSQRGRYKEIHQLGEVQTLAYNCENGIPGSKTVTAPQSELMILTSEASSSVNLYLASLPPQS